MPSILRLQPARAYDFTGCRAGRNGRFDLEKPMAPRRSQIGKPTQGVNRAGDGAGCAGPGLDAAMAASASCARKSEQIVARALCLQKQTCSRRQRVSPRPAPALTESSGPSWAGGGDACRPPRGRVPADAAWGEAREVALELLAGRHLDACALTIVGDTVARLRRLGLPAALIGGNARP